MASSRNVAPSGVWKGCPLPTGKEYGEGLCTFCKFVAFWAQNDKLLFWELVLLQLNSLSYTHKTVSLDFSL